MNKGRIIDKLDILADSKHEIMQQRIIFQNINNLYDINSNNYLFTLVKLSVLREIARAAVPTQIIRNNIIVPVNFSLTILMVKWLVTYGAENIEIKIFFKDGWSRRESKTSYST